VGSDLTCRWRTDENTLSGIREMIKLRTDLVNPEILKVTTTDEQVPLEDTSTEDAMKSISEAINEENGLCCEVIWSAMQCLKADPRTSIPDAIEYGFGEWIK
jgi:hypothetical protein